MKNPFSKKRKGNTLIEVLVSILIIGIVTGSVISVLVSLKKTRNKTVLRRNIICAVESTLNDFSAAPENIENFSPAEGAERYRYLPYNVNFAYVDENRDNNYLLLTLKEEQSETNMFYTLTVRIFVGNKEYNLPNQNRIERKILVKGGQS